MEKVTKERFLAYLAGQAEAQRFIEDERDRRLSTLTGAESREQFDALCALVPLRGPQDRAAADEERVSFLLERRRLLDLLAVKRTA